MIYSVYLHVRKCKKQDVMMEIKQSGCISVYLRFAVVDNRLKDGEKKEVTEGERERE